MGGLASDADKRIEQQRISASYRMEYQGTGPAATGGDWGWAMPPGLFFRCTRCGYFMAADPTAYDTCLCGDLHKDAGAGRLGSRQGDAAIEVYRGHPIDSVGPAEATQ